MNTSEIVLVRFPFSTLESEKKRPALVLNNVKLTSKISLHTIAMITSKIDGIKLDGDILLNGWKESGLLHPSLLRLSKIATIEQELITKILGKLTSSDEKVVKKAFSTLFKHWS